MSTKAYAQVKSRLENRGYETLARARQSISRTKISEPKREQLRQLAESIFTTRAVSDAAKKVPAHAAPARDIAEQLNMSRGGIPLDEKLQNRMKAAGECYRSIAETADKHGIDVKTLCTDLVHLDTFYRQLGSLNGLGN